MVLGTAVEVIVGVTVLVAASETNEVLRAELGELSGITVPQSNPINPGWHVQLNALGPCCAAIQVLVKHSAAMLYSFSPSVVEVESQPIKQPRSQPSSPNSKLASKQK